MRPARSVPSLAEALAAARRAFPDHGLGGPLRVCTCPSCTSPEAKRAIEATPRDALGADLVAEYVASAHEVAGDPVAVRQLKWILPRLLECCADGPWPALSTEGAFARLAEAGLTGWPEPERAALRAVFLGLFARALAGAGPQSPAELLFAFVRAGEPAAPYLDAWDADRGEAASAALADFALCRLSYAYGRPTLGEHGRWPPAAEALVVAWLLRPETVERLADAVMAAEDARAARLISDAHGFLEGAAR